MKRYFITGLLVWIPLGITIWALSFLIGTLDQSLLLLPEALQPRSLFGYHIHGLGVILTLLVVFLTGLVATNINGQRLVMFWEGLLRRIPVVKSTYYSVKQVSDTLFTSKGEAFKKVLLVNYPHHDSWMLAFQTALPGAEVESHLKDEYVGVYVPTTPNPTSGFYLLMRRSDVIELEMSVDVALRYIISMGVIAPESKVAKFPGRRLAPEVAPEAASR